MFEDKLFCPLCGKVMQADIHPDSIGGQDSDNWTCNGSYGDRHFVLFMRDDIDNWLRG